MSYEYVREGGEIYRRSFATIRAETDLSRFPADVARVVVRMIHACGMVDLVDDVEAHPEVVAAGYAALAAGAPVLCDAAMVAAGITRTRLPADNKVVCTLRDPAVPELARQFGTTRSAAGSKPRRISARTAPSSGTSSAGVPLTSTTPPGGRAT